MNNKEINETPENRLPDTADEKKWDDFSRELWFMFKKAEDSDDFEMNEFAVEAQNSPPQTKRTNSRVNCLTFDRCAEIGQRQSEISERETIHVADCRFCTRRIEQYAGLPEKEKAFTVSEVTAATPEVIEERAKKSWWSKILANGGTSFFGGFGGRLAFAGFALIALLGTAAFVFVSFFNQTGERLAVITDSQNSAPNLEMPVNRSTEMNENANNSVNSPVNDAKNSAVKEKPTPTPILRENEPLEEPPLELAYLDDRNREAVQQSLQAGRIQLSEDIAKLRESPITRAGENVFAPQISPKDEATLESQPVLSWKNVEGDEYQIIVFDRELNEVAKSGVLTQNNWQIDKSLRADFYFWQVRVKKKDAAKFDERGEKAFFKIVGGAEKAQIEKAKRSSKSNLVTAVLYARAGLFREAERELETELRKNPSSSKARKMLLQVRRWRSR